ncbi:MAG: DUF86 domain-containing protein [Cyanobacteriota bacterium]|nr:DUF86 domain-containing protein [Cyanobacteriota bacterium]
MTKIDDLTRLKHMRDSARTAIDFIRNKGREDLDNEQMLSLALVRLIEIIGEAANNVSLACQTSYPQIPWREIVGMRNRIVHAYFEVDLDVVWQVVADNLPELLKWVDRAIQELEEGE